MLPGNKSETYKYDNNGNLIDVTYSEGKVKYEYDKLNRLIEEEKTIASLDRTFTVEYEYDEEGNLVNTAYPDGRDVTSEYNNLNQIKNVNYEGDQITSYSYDGVGNLTNRQDGNNLKVTYTYDDANRMDVLSITKTGTEKYKQDYDYDPEGNRSQLLDHNNRITKYGYDKKNQLTTVDFEHNTKPGNDYVFDYDPVGNRQTFQHAFGTEQYSYANNCNKLERKVLNNTGYIDYKYDNNGNLTNEKQYVKNGQAVRELQTKSYTWNAENRLLQIAIVKAPNNPNEKLQTNLISFTYDHLGQRVSKSVNGKATYYLYQGIQVIAECDSEGNIIDKFIYGHNKVGRVTENKITYHYEDVISSVNVVADAQGNFSQMNIQDAFGNCIYSEGSDKNDYTFAGKEKDESGLFYFVARYYDPTLGRFISRDAYRGKLDIPISQNLYIYVRNNPLRYIDPTGNLCEKLQNNYENTQKERKETDKQLKNAQLNLKNAGTDGAREKFKNEIAELTTKLSELNKREQGLAKEVKKGLESDAKNHGLNGDKKLNPEQINVLVDGKIQKLSSVLDRVLSQKDFKLSASEWGHVKNVLGNYSELNKSKLKLESTKSKQKPITGLSKEKIMAGLFLENNEWVSYEQYKAEFKVILAVAQNRADKNWAKTPKTGSQLDKLSYQFYDAKKGSGGLYATDNSENRKALDARLKYAQDSTKYNKIRNPSMRSAMKERHRAAEDAIKEHMNNINNPNIPKNVFYAGHKEPYNKKFASPDLMSKRKELGIQAPRTMYLKTRWKGGKQY